MIHVLEDISKQRNCLI